jgi:hypothetical protein
MFKDKPTRQANAIHHLLGGLFALPGAVLLSSSSSFSGNHSNLAEKRKRGSASEDNPSSFKRRRAPSPPDYVPDPTLDPLVCGYEFVEPVSADTGLDWKNSLLRFIYIATVNSLHTQSHKSHQRTRDPTCEWKWNPTRRKLQYLLDGTATNHIHLDDSK